MDVDGQLLQELKRTSDEADVLAEQHRIAGLLRQSVQPPRLMSCAHFSGLVPAPKGVVLRTVIVSLKGAQLCQLCSD